MNVKKRYNRWTARDRKKLRDNYLLMNNKELSILLERTPDAVRKELNNLQLKRPRKGDIAKLNKYIPKDRKIFKNLKDGRKKREKNERDIHKINKKIKTITEHERKKQKQKKYHSNGEYKPGEDYEIQPLKILVDVYVDSRTTLKGIEKGKEKEALETYKQYLEKRK